MQSRIILDTNSAGQPVEAALLPCFIKHNGLAPVAEHFAPTALPSAENPSTGAASEPTQEAYFRGRRLLAVTVPLPTSYRAFVFDSAQQAQSRAINRDEDEDQEMEEVRTFKAQAELGRLTVYGNASAPDPATPQLRIEAWLALAKAVHNA